MNTNLVLSTIDQLTKEVSKLNSISSKKKEKFIKSLNDVHKKYQGIEVPEELKKQYNQLNSKGTELIKDLKNLKIKEKNEVEHNVETYIRYLKASTCDFEGRNIYLRKYITSFLFCAILFLALSPQFYGFILPILFFLPIYLGLKGVKQRSMTGFYMTMSVVPVAFMTAVTWIRYGLNASQDYTGAINAIVSDGVSQKLAQNLVWIGPLLGSLLLVFSAIQLYRGLKSKDLFI